MDRFRIREERSLLVAVFLFSTYIVMTMYVHHKQEELHTARLMSLVKKLNSNQIVVDMDGEVIYTIKRGIKK